MGSIRVDLKPVGKAALVAVPGMLAIETRELERPWNMPLDHLAEVTWHSPHGASFRSQGLTGPATADVAPAMVDIFWTGADVRMSFTQPLQVPYRRGRSLWPLWQRSTVMWKPPSQWDPSVLWPPGPVRAGRATSLELRAASDVRALKRALEHSGVVFPEFSTGP